MEIQRADLEDILWDAGLDPDDVLQIDYSGRGMYGRQCVGLTCTLGESLQFVSAVTRKAEREGEPCNWLFSVQEDGMGLGSIYYWPGVQVVG